MRGIEPAHDRGLVLMTAPTPANDAPVDPRPAHVDLPVASLEDEWLAGWDPTPGIVSVWAEPDGRASIWRRLPGSGALVRDDLRFRPWMVLATLDDLAHLGGRLRPERDGPAPRCVTFRELSGPGALRFLVRADDLPTLIAAVCRGAARRLGRPIGHVRDLPANEVLVLPPEEQYLVATGRTYFRGLPFDDLRRLQVDLETTGLDPARDQIFLAAVRGPDGATEILEVPDGAPGAEAELIARLVAHIQACDPDVIENHNLHGFDLPFLERRARALGVPLALGRAGAPGLRQRAARRGVPSPANPARRIRYTVPGRELIDTLDAVLRHDFAARDLPGHGLKAVARHMGLARDGREQIPGAQIHDVWTRDPARVRRYAADDVAEVAGLARTLGGAAFVLAGMVPRRYERLADAGAATGILDPLLVRAYLRSGAALPAHEPGDGTPHSGAALHLFAAGVAHRVVKADVASLYPSLMREYRIGPVRDRLGALLAIVDRLVERRLAAKARGRAAPPGSPERHASEAMSAAMKLVVNSAYGYLGATGLTRFSDVHAANRITRHGRDVLALLCRELAARGTTLLEADTDGVYFAVPAHWTPADERRVVAEVAALLPARVHLELDGRYAAMLSHEPKNYALLAYDGPLILRGVAFRSSRAEPFGERFLRRALEHLLRGDLAGVQHVYIDTVTALRRRQIPTRDVAARVRLTRTPAQYLALRDTRHELPYEALLASGRTEWTVGERVRVYRATRGRARLAVDLDEDDEPDDDDADGDADAPVTPGARAAGAGATTGAATTATARGGAATTRERGAPTATDPRDYDVEHYLRVLRDTFAARLQRAMNPEDFATVFADPEQPSLFARSLAGARPILTAMTDPMAAETAG
ncbi:MAG TPA: DNA polymerase domain-containing protein [Kofleriaceae bacterium]|nr:DNA polymerase domain-containing protein [Kofleriaceae bacterium]